MNESAPDRSTDRKGKSIHMNLKPAVAVLAAIAVAALSFTLAPSASATPATTTDVSWTTDLAPGGNVPPQGADDVTWPQSLTTTGDTCGHVLQIDTYKYGTEQEKAAVEALIAHGTLNKPGSPDWTDSALVLSWMFVIQPACVVNATPVAPTVTQAACDKDTGTLTPPSVTLPVTTGIDYTQADAKGGVLVTATPQAGYTLVDGGGFTISKDGTGELLITFDVVTCVKPSPTPPPPHSTPPVTHPSTPVVHPVTHPVSPVAHAEPLANTGPHTGLLLGTGIGVLLAGIALLLVGNRRRGEHR